MTIDELARRGFSIMSISMIASCVSSVDSPLIGGCYETASSYELWNHKRGEAFIGKYLLASELTPQQKEDRTLVGIVDAKTQFRVVEVIKGITGSTGQYLRVIVQIEKGEHQGKVADIPTCADFHPSKWIDRCTSDPDEVSISPTRATQCSS